MVLGPNVFCFIKNVFKYNFFFNDFIQISKKIKCTKCNCIIDFNENKHFLGGIGEILCKKCAPITSSILKDSNTIILEDIDCSLLEKEINEEDRVEMVILQPFVSYNNLKIVINRKLKVIIFHFKI